MNKHYITELISQATGTSFQADSFRSAGGGCINQCMKVFSGQTSFFVKINDLSHTGLFKGEAKGLQALKGAVADSRLRVPAVIALGTSDGKQYLVLEHIEQGAKAGDFWEAFGRSLAEMHRRQGSTRFGFAEDNHIGATPQRNTWKDSWITFFAEERIGFQTELARSKGRLDSGTVKGCEAIMNKMDSLLPEPDHPHLLHGDLWGGNYMTDTHGNPVLIDPAVYYGHRECDLAMTELFGGFSGQFYKAYENQWPLTPGYEKRKELYNLYHMLNHLNLFGSSYLGSVKSIVRRFS